jgi:Glycosyltransferase family 20
VCTQIFRALAHGELLLQGMLSANIVGFHAFDHARHFLNAGKRLLGLSYQSIKVSKFTYVALVYCCCMLAMLALVVTPQQHRKGSYHVERMNGSALAAVYLCGDFSSLHRCTALHY